MQHTGPSTSNNCGAAPACPPTQRIANEVRKDFKKADRIIGTLPPIPVEENAITWPKVTLNDMRKELSDLLKASGKAATYGQTVIECLSKFAQTWLIAALAGVQELITKAATQGGMPELDSGLLLIAGLSGAGVLLDIAGNRVKLRRPYAIDRALEASTRTRYQQLNTSLGETPDTQNKLTKISNKTWLIKYCCEAYRSLPSEVVAFATPLIGIWTISPQFGVLLGLIGTLSIMHGHRLGRESAIIAERTAEETRGYESKVNPLRRPEGISELKRTGKAEVINKELSQDHETITEAYMVADERMTLRDALTSTMTVCTGILATFYGVYSAVAGTMTVQQGIFLGGAAVAFGVAMTRLCGHIRVFAQTQEYLREYAELGKQAALTAKFERDPKKELERRWESAPNIVVKNANAIVRSQEEVYPKKIVDKTLISDVNLDIQSGKLIAIIGLKGAGKSTVIRLLTGELELRGENATIQFGDLTLSQESLVELRANMSIMSQNPTLIESKSVQANVDLGTSIWEENTDPQQREYKKLIIDFLKDQQISPDWVVGADFTNGRRLSPGEVKVVAVARTLIKGSKLVIMDEPTTSLDSATGKQVIQLIKSLSNATRLVVTHDAKLLEKCDQVIVVNRKGHPLFGVDRNEDVNAPGTIAMTGTHEELLAKCPEYRKYLDLPAE